MFDPAASDSPRLAPAIPDTDAIARRAHDKFVARGYEHGHDVEDWCAAEQELLDERDRH